MDASLPAIAKPQAKDGDPEFAEYRPPDNECHLVKFPLLRGDALGL
jgi:hypothetical protein